MNKEEQSYLDLMTKVITEGEEVIDRTGVGTYKLFGNQLRFNLNNSFPLMTSKKIHFKSVVHELLWFLKGDTNIQYLKDNNVKIWDAWADNNGNLGPVYGKQWTNWFKYDHKAGLYGSTSINQIENVIKQIKEDPSSRRMVVSAWNVSDLSDMALAPCHCLFQFNVIKGKLSCQLYQRSSDLFLGLPFNIASYALLTHLIASICDLEVGELVVTLGDYHVYKNHLEAVKTQLNRIPLDFPKLKLKRRITDINDVKFDDIELIDYSPYSSIKAPVAV